MRSRHYLPITAAALMANITIDVREAFGAAAVTRGPRGYSLWIPRETAVAIVAAAVAESYRSERAA